MHFAVVVSNAAGTVYGQDLTFVPGSSTATTGPSTAVSDTSETLDGQVNSGGVATTYQYQYGTTTAYGSTIPSTPGDAGSGSITQDLPVTVTGLTPATTYHYRIVATNVTGSAYGADVTFTTPQAPTASSSPVTIANQWSIS